MTHASPYHTQAQTCPYHTQPQIPSMNQRPNGTYNPSPTRHLPTTPVSSVPDSSKTHPKYLNSDTCSSCIPSTQTSHFNPSSPPYTITLLLPALTFRSLFIHTLTKRPTIVLRSSSVSPHKTKASAYKRSGNLHSLPSYPFPFSPLSSLHPYIH